MNSTDCIGVVGFSTDKYWLDGSNNVLSKYGGTTNVNPFYDINVYETSNTAPTIDCSSGRCYVTNSGYTIGYYVNQYTNKLKSYGVTIHEGRLLKTEEAGNLGCETGGSGYHCRGNSTQFMRNTAYWMEGLFDKNTVRAIQFNNINRESTQSSVANYGVRPVIVMNTSDIPLLPHEYFENKPVIAY